MGPLRSFRMCVSLLAVAGGALFARPAAPPLLVRDGRAEAVIVVGRAAGTFQRRVAGELQRFIKAVSGAELPIAECGKLPAGQPLLIVGGPKTNPLVAAAERQGLVRFAGLKPDGFVLKRVALQGRPALIIGGNDEAGTMYAAYDLLERLGVVFQLTGDIIPQVKPDLPLPELDVRKEPVFKDRGMHCWHGIRWYMGLADFRRLIDQLAKMKMNVLQFYWGMGGPWIQFRYGGKAMATTATRESGFVAWPGASGTARAVTVGRDCFPESGYLGPPEFAGVKTPERAFRTAREFLREVIRYAHTRKVKVWLNLGEIPFVPPNLAPPHSRRGRSFYCGVSLSPGDPAVLDIWEAALLSMIETYPEADRYWVVGGSELLGASRPVHAFPADDPQVQTLIRDYEHLRPLIPPKSGAAKTRRLADLDLADIAVADKLVRRVKAHHPDAPLGMALIFRGGQLRALDAVLPKDVALMNMVNFTGETAMSYFSGIRGRELVVWPRVTDDGCELNMQLNAMMYDHDETIAGAVRYGLTGVLGQLNKERGAEPSAQYIAEGAWNPEIHCRSFYEQYLGRLYGPKALGPLMNAFSLLEENEKALGWRGRHGLFSTWSASCRMAAALRRVDYRRKDLHIDRTELEQAIRRTETEEQFWRGRAAQCARALALLRQARPKVWPGSRAELNYVIYKTDNFITIFKLLGAINEARVAFDRALLAMESNVARAEADRHLEHCRAATERANCLAHLAAEQMIPYARRWPTERHILWIFNKIIPSHEAARRYVADVIAFRKKQGS
ncbi:MAG: hypothetical protein GXP27_14760 [Planctomycetes bacterium]|nr:hypothetical protein [Planctomycetota bacterium]